MELDNLEANGLDPYLIDTNYGFQNRIIQILKIINYLLRNEKLGNRCRMNLDECYQLLAELYDNEKQSLKPTTRRLKNQINQALLENKYGDGVIVRILKKQDYKIEKCSLLNFYINEK